MEEALAGFIAEMDNDPTLQAAIANGFMPHIDNPEFRLGFREGWQRRETAFDKLVLDALRAMKRERDHEKSMIECMRSDRKHGWLEGLNTVRAERKVAADALINAMPWLFTE